MNHRRNTMKRLGIFASCLVRSNHLAVFSARSTTVRGPAIRGVTGVAIKALCPAFLIVFATTAGLAQTTGSSTDGWVVLPVNEYRALRRAAFPADAEPVPPPVEATLTRIDYDLKVEGDLASGEARLTVDVIKDGWVRLAIPDGLMVREAQLDGRQVTLVARPK